MITQIIHAESISLQSTPSDYVLEKNVILLLVQDSTARLLKLDGEFCVINVIGALILVETLKSTSTTAVNKIASEYAIELAQAQKDVQIFLENLEKKGFIYCPESFLTQSKRLEFDCTFLLQPLLRLIHICPISLQVKAWIALGLSYLSIRLFGLPRTVKAWNVNCIVHQETTSLIEEIDLAVRDAMAHHLLNVQCKECALCCWWLARSSGFSAKLALGIGLFPLASHCWCEVDTKILADDLDRCEVFTPILTYE